MPFQKSPSDRKPPLPESMNQLRSRRMLRSSTTSLIPSSPVSMMRPQTPKQEKPDQYGPLTTDLEALMKMVKDGFGNQDMARSSSVAPFERGRFYDEYSARRNERLTRRRKGETTAAVEEKNKKPTSVYNLGVADSTIKKRVGGGEQKILGSLRKSVPTNFKIPRSETTSRYSLRSSTSKITTTTTMLSSSGKLSFDGGERSSKINTRRGVR
ncbi:hypothetical protein MKW94_020232 [Papaver nudicaule]|uniref:Uncharacterized protein n=1 Tax=Papaver nudicaule TaxID=74823 RepID=A0AA42B2B7_PAPNU|nr:hypothetical protein [Papaver nudicaule]